KLRADASTTALVASRKAAFETALGQPDLARRPFEHGRIRLLFGEWLRRKTRDVPAARHQIHLAVDILEQIGARPWADRGRAELRASGLSQLYTAPSRQGLTEQEIRIARLAGKGMTNKQIAVRLHLSPRTVGAHLYKVFPKLGISTRGELQEALDGST